MELIYAPALIFVLVSSAVWWRVRHFAFRRMMFLAVIAIACWTPLSLIVILAGNMSQPVATLVAAAISVVMVIGLVELNAWESHWVQTKRGKLAGQILERLNTPAYLLYKQFGWSEVTTTTIGESDETTTAEEPEAPAEAQEPPAPPKKTFPDLRIVNE